MQDDEVIDELNKEGRFIPLSIRLYTKQSEDQPELNRQLKKVMAKNLEELEDSNEESKSDATLRNHKPG
jgi:hypothetical protein